MPYAVRWKSRSAAPGRSVHWTSAAVPVVAPPLPEGELSLAQSMAVASTGTSNTTQFDLSHHPALSVPCGRVSGLPVGMMLVGRHYDETTLYRIAYAFEQA